MKTGGSGTLVFVRSAGAQGLEARREDMSVQSVESMADQMMAAIFILCGLYCAALYLMRGRADAMRKAKLLYPRGCAPERCADLPGYLRELMPRVLALGAGLIVFGAAGVLFPRGTLAALLLLVLPLCLLGWFVSAQSRLAEKYWRRR